MSLRLCPSVNRQEWEFHALSSMRNHQLPLLTTARAQYKFRVTTPPRQSFPLGPFRYFQLPAVARTFGLNFVDHIPGRRVTIGHATQVEHRASGRFEV
jgi:hypothetical protein